MYSRLIKNKCRDFTSVPGLRFNSLGSSVRRRLKPGIHWRQSRQLPKPATNRRHRDLSPVCRRSTVAGSFDNVDRIAVDIVAKVEHVQLGRL